MWSTKLMLMTLTWQVEQDGGDCTRRALRDAHQICSTWKTVRPKTRTAQGRRL